MDTDLVFLLFGWVLFFFVGLALFLIWKFFEPKREGEPRSLIDFVVKPAIVMAGGVALLGIFALFPQAWRWIIAVIVVIVAVAFIRMPASQKKAMVIAFEKADLTTGLPFARLVLVFVVVLATVAGLLAIFIRQ